MRHDHDHEQLQLQLQPQLQHENHNRSVALNAKKSRPIFFLALLLLGVLMSVSNIRHAVQTLPGTHDDYVRTRLDEGFRDKRPSLNVAKNTSAIAYAANLDNFTLDNATPALSTPLSSSKLLLLETPDNDNTVISLVSMGRLVNTYLVERCIRSIRRRGLFSGNILVFTDEIGYERYQKSVLPWDNRTKIISGRDEDMNPRDPINEKLKKYAQATMVFKRFKTHHSKYIAADRDLSDSIRYVMYVDVDNIIGAPLSDFFLTYSNGVASEYQRAFDEHQKWKHNITTTLGKVRSGMTPEDDNNHDGFGFISMFRDKHLRGKMHSGVIIYDRKFEERCANGWRNEMDTFFHSSDQTMFLRVLDNYNSYQCTAFALPDKYMSFANKRLMISGTEARQKPRKRRKQLNLPTFVHVTSYRVRHLNNATIHDDFVRHILDLKDNEKITDDIRWEDVVPYNAERKGKER